MTERESMQYDVVIVGAGPAGLSAAIRLKQLANEAGRDLSVCILEKGSEVGAHILSGAVIDPIALNELIPDWRDKGSPLTVPVTENHHWVLSKGRKWEFPHWLMPAWTADGADRGPRTARGQKDSAAHARWPDSVTRAR
jgi:electron-transferring-flavoprotein dehydrogenase